MKQKNEEKNRTRTKTIYFGIDIYIYLEHTILWLFLIVLKCCYFICLSAPPTLSFYIFSFHLQIWRNFLFFSISITLIQTCTTNIRILYTHSLELLRCNKVSHTQIRSVCVLIIINNLWRKKKTKMKNKKRSMCCCQQKRNQDQQQSLTL